jgi:predicted kinase
VVSNTFTQEWEMQSYIDLAKKYGYQVTTLIVENRHGNSNVHNVPAETLDRMRQRFEVKL